MSDQKNNEPAMEVLLLTVKDAANCLRMSRAAIYILLKRNILPTVRIGRSVRISSQALRQFVAELEADEAAAQADEEAEPKRRSAK